MCKQLLFFWSMLLLHGAVCTEEIKSLKRHRKKNLREGNSVKILNNTRVLLNSVTVTPVTESGDMAVENDIDVQALSSSLCTMNNVLENDDVVNNVPLGIVSDTFKAGSVTFSEKFAGMGLKTPLGVFGIQDELIPKFTEDTRAALKLQSNLWFSQNIYTDLYCGNEILRKQCTVRILGRGPAGDKGSGSISAFFKNDQKSFEIKFWSHGATDLVALFYKRTGEYLGTEDVDVVNNLHYSFKRDERDIAGVAIYPKGEVDRWHKFGITGICIDE